MQMQKELVRPSPFNNTFSIEARCLIWAHLNRVNIDFLPFNLQNCIFNIFINYF